MVGRGEKTDFRGKLTIRKGVEEKHKKGKKKQPKGYKKNEKSQRNKMEKVSRKWP